MANAWMADAWMAAFDAAQRTAKDEVALAPLGFWRPRTACRNDLTNMLLTRYAPLWNVRRA